MSGFSISLPYTLFTLGALLVIFVFRIPTGLGMGYLALSIFHPDGKKARRRKFLGMGKKTVSRVLVILGLLPVLAVYTLVFLYFTDNWLRAEPGPSRQREIQHTDTAIIMAFGFEKGPEGQLLPGASNEFLLKWTLENTAATTLLVQEGVWVAAPGDETGRPCLPGGKRMIRMHRHEEGLDVKTFEAAVCALGKMVELEKTSALLVAHDFQLQRTAWIFERLKQSRPEWRHFRFTVPQMPPVPFPENSAQCRTRYRWFYKGVELFVSRFLAFALPADSECDAYVEI